MKKRFLAVFLCAAAALFSQTRPNFTAYSLKSLQSYPFRESPIAVNSLAFKNSLQYAYNISYTSMGLSVSGRLSVPVLPVENLKGMVIMLRGYQNARGYYTGKGTENPARSYLQQGWAVIAPDFLGYAGSSPAPEPAELHQFYSTLNAVELYLSLLNPEFRYGSVAPGDRAVPSSFKKIVFWGHSNGGQVAIQTLETLGRPVPYCGRRSARLFPTAWRITGQTWPAGPPRSSAIIRLPIFRFLNFWTESPRERRSCLSREQMTRTFQKPGATLLYGRSARRTPGGKNPAGEK